MIAEGPSEEQEEAMWNEFAEELGGLHASLSKSFGGPGFSKFRVRFHGEEYLLIGNLKQGGAIATEQQFDNFEMSTAHLFPNGVVMSYGQVVGCRDDIEIIQNLSEDDQ